MNENAAHVASSAVLNYREASLRLVGLQQLDMARLGVTDPSSENKSPRFNVIYGVAGGKYRREVKIEELNFNFEVRERK